MKYFQDIIKEINREDIIKYYWEENHTYKECCEYFQIGGGQFARLLKHFDAKKPSNLHAENIAKSKQSKYGSATYNNRDKAKETCLHKYGVDNPFKDTNNIKQSFEDKYGVDHPMHVDEFKERSVKNHDYASSIRKAHDTYLRKTGYDNPRKNPEVISKWKQTQRENGSFSVAGSSILERRLEKILRRRYDDLVTKYTDSRYQRSDGYCFECDFYVPSDDLFIELNGHYTHRNVLFDATDQGHVQLAEKLSNSEKKWERDTYNTWCIRDVQKYQAAKTNELNYVVLYPSNTIFYNQQINDKKYSKLISSLLKKLNE